MKLLHIYNDNKFKEYILYTFEINGLHNELINIRDEFPKNIDVSEYSLIIIHYLGFESQNFIRKINNKPIVVFIWGGDIFSLGKFYNYFLEKKTLILRTILTFKNGIKIGGINLIKTVLPWMVDITKDKKQKLEILNKIDLIVPIMPGDYELLQEKYKIKTKHYHINYINPIFNKNPEFPKVGKSNILLGNSSSYTNNHIEAIDFICKKIKDFNKIILPLNYGDIYLRSYVAKYATKRLGKENVIVLDKLMDFDDYQNLISSCSIVIMNHKRQQALGNIVQALYSGAHVYLNPESTIFAYLKDNGVVISPIENKSKLFSLNEQQMIYNIQKVKELFGPEKQKNRIIKLLSNLVN